MPSASALDTARSMLERPEEEMQSRYISGISGKGPLTLEPISPDQYQTWREEQATFLGLTVHGFDSSAQVSNYDNPDKAIKTTRNFLGLYGIGLSFGDKKAELYGIDGEALTQEQRRSKELANNLVAMNVYISKYPVQFLNKIGLRKIVLMEGAVTDVGDIIDQKVAGEVNPTLQPGVIFLDYAAASATDHEIAHLVDEAMGCLGSEDRTTLRTNGRDIYGKPTTSTTLSLEKFQKDQGVNPQLDANAVGAFKAKKKQVATLSSYGITNRDEDIAEINKDIQRGFFGRYKDGLAPVLHEKFLNQLARLHMLDPATTKFISTTSYHGDPFGVEGIK